MDVLLHAGPFPPDRGFGDGVRSQNDRGCCAGLHGRLTNGLCAGERHLTAAVSHAQANLPQDVVGHVAHVVVVVDGLVGDHGLLLLSLL